MSEKRTYVTPLQFNLLKEAYLKGQLSKKLFTTDLYLSPEQAQELGIKTTTAVRLPAKQAGEEATYSTELGLEPLYAPEEPTRRVEPTEVKPDEELLFQEYQRTGGQLDFTGWQYAGSPLRYQYEYEDLDQSLQDVFGGENPAGLRMWLFQDPAANIPQLFEWVQERGRTRESDVLLTRLLPGITPEEINELWGEVVYPKGFKLPEEGGLTLGEAAQRFMGLPAEEAPPTVTLPSGRTIEYPMLQEEWDLMTVPERIAYQENPQQWIEDKENWVKVRDLTRNIKIVAEGLGFPTELYSPTQQLELFGNLALWLLPIPAGKVAKTGLQALERVMPGITEKIIAKVEPVVSQLKRIGETKIPGPFREALLSERGGFIVNEDLWNKTPVNQRVVNARAAGLSEAVGRKVFKELTPEEITALEKLSVPTKGAPAKVPGLVEREIDEAGYIQNIRLEKYPEDLRETIQGWAETHVKEVAEARRGIVSDAQVLRQAEKLVSEVGGDLDKLRSRWKAGQAWNAEELVAVREVLAGKTRNVINAQKIALENNSAENLLKLELALKEQAAVQETVHGLTAEAGRALRSFRQQVAEAISSGDTEQMERILRAIGGREKTENVAKLLSQIDINDPVAVNRFIQSLYEPHFTDYITELFYNSILSGPKTHIVNSMSNTANALFSPVERFVSSVVDMPLAILQRRERTRFFSEVSADIFGAMRGIPEGFRQFAYIVKNGISFDQATKWEFRPKAFKGKLGATVGMPSRFLEAADALMKSINYRAALNATAHRIASKAKLKGMAFEQRVAELLSNPTREMLAEAEKIAEYRLFRQEPGRFGRTLYSLREAVDVAGLKPLRFVIPFLRTPMNLVKYGLERSPVGFLSPKLWQNVATKSPEAADQIARAIIGSIGTAAITWYAAEGMITGAPPRNAAERERFYREGKQPYAIRVDGFWVSYQRLEPFNQLLSQAAIIVDMIRNNDDGIEEKIGDAVNTFGQNFISQTYMSSVSDLINMLAEPERYAGRWLNRFATSIGIPMSSATRTAAQMLDRIVRDPQNVVEEFEANIPGLSKSVQSKLTALGEDIMRKSPPWFPINVTPVEETILSQELERLKFNIGFVGGTISGFELTEDEQREYQILAGQAIKQDLERLMLAPEYWTSTDTDREKMLQKVVNTAREYARENMLQKLWTSGTDEERMKNLGKSLSDANNQLGKNISSVPEFSHEDPEIYSVDRDLDSAYRALLENVPEDVIKELDPPPSVYSWYAKERALDETSVIADKTLTSIDREDLEDYYIQWQERLKITDEKELAEFDKTYPDANLGNITKRQLDFLRQYHQLSPSEQRDFLEGHPELSLNPYEEWVKSHPTENAQMAIWGEAKLLSMEAYNEFTGLIEELDIPDSALPKMTLPPKASVENYFKYQEMVDEYGANSVEVKSLLLQDDELRAWLGRQPIEDSPRELELKIRLRELDEGVGLEDADTVRSGLESINEMQQQALEDIRAGTLEKPLEHEMIRAIEYYQEIIDILDDVSEGKMPDEQKRLDLVENLDAIVKYYQDRLENIKAREYPLTDADINKFISALSQTRDFLSELTQVSVSIKDRSTEYKEVYYELQALSYDIPEELTKTYIDWYMIDRKGFDDDWYLQENPDFYQMMVDRGVWKERDFSKVPTREVYALYEEYLSLPEGTIRKQFRIEYPELDSWLVLAKGYKPATSY